MTRLALPLALLLVLAPIARLVFLRKRRLRPAIRISSDRLIRHVGPTFRQRLLWMPTFLRLTTLTLLAVAIARPQAGFGVVQTSAEAVAIELVLDRSSSMSEPIVSQGQRVSRFEIAKRLLQDFVLGDGRGLTGRPHDPVGLVTFARFAETVAPLTRAHDALASVIEQSEMAQFKAEDGTAIGDAIALAAARLQSAEDVLERQRRIALDVNGSGRGLDAPDSIQPAKIKSKIIIFLTDGLNNFGDMNPVDAANLAAEWGIKIYAIGVGDTLASVNRAPIDIFARRVVSGVDQDALRQIAEITGGRAWVASDANDLRNVYEQIDKLEKTEIHSVQYTNYDERFSLFAAVALATLALEALLGATILRRTP